MYGSRSGFADSSRYFRQVTAGIFKELTGFDRSMVIQFDEDWNGRVVAEQVDRTRSKDCYLDLTFPAADIASASLAKSKLSLLYNRDAAQVNMCGRTKEQIERPVDMTRCQFRTPPVERLRYLAQRGVRSTMNVSLFAFSKLWGIVTLFSHGPAGHRVSVPIRNLCSYLGESLSRTIERLSYERRLQARRIINTSASTEGPATIVSRGEDLLELFNSDFGCLRCDSRLANAGFRRLTVLMLHSVGEEAKILGEVSNAQEILAILEYLRAQCFTTVQMRCERRRKELYSNELTKCPIAPQSRDFCRFSGLPCTRSDWLQGNRRHAGRASFATRSRFHRLLSPRDASRSALGRLEARTPVARRHRNLAPGVCGQIQTVG